MKATFNDGTSIEKGGKVYAYAWKVVYLGTFMKDEEEVIERHGWSGSKARAESAADTHINRITLKGKRGRIAYKEITDNIK
jgi:hypothetical protein